MRFLFNAKSELAELFAQERCNECATLKKRIQKLERERELQKGRERARESEARAEREAREAQMATADGRSPAGRPTGYRLQGAAGSGGAPTDSTCGRGLKRPREEERAASTVEPIGAQEAPKCEATSSQETAAWGEDEAMSSQETAAWGEDEAVASQAEEVVPASSQESDALGPSSSSTAVADSGMTRHAKAPAAANADSGALDGGMTASAPAGTALRAELSATLADFNAHRTRAHPPISAAARYTAVSAAVRRAVGQDLSRLSPAEIACCAACGPRIFDHRRR